MARRELSTQPDGSLLGAGDGRRGRAIEKNADPNDARKRRRSFLGIGRLPKLIRALLRRSHSSPPTVRPPQSTPSTVQGQKPDGKHNARSSESISISPHSSFLRVIAGALHPSEVPSVPGFKFSVTNDDESQSAQPSSSPVDQTTISVVTGGTASEISLASSHQGPATKTEEGAPANLSNSSVDQTTARENKPSRKGTLYSGGRLVLDFAKEVSDVCTPLKSAAGGLSAILKYYDVRCTYFTKPFVPLTFGLANDGEPQND